MVSASERGGGACNGNSLLEAHKVISSQAMPQPSICMQWWLSHKVAPGVGGGGFLLHIGSVHTRVVRWWCLAIIRVNGPTSDQQGPALNTVTRLAFFLRIKGGGNNDDDDEEEWVQD